MSAPARITRTRGGPGLLAMLAVGVVASGCAGAALRTRVVDRGVGPIAPAAAGGPRSPVRELSVAAAGVALWLELADVDGTHSIEARWRDPDGRLHTTTGPVPLNPDGGYRPTASFTATLPLRGGPASLLPGAWSVELRYDGERLLTETFAITAPTGGGGTP